MSIDELIRKADVGSDYALSAWRYLLDLRSSSDIDDQEEYEKLAISSCEKAIEHLSFVLHYLKEED